MFCSSVHLGSARVGSFDEHRMPSGYHPRLAVNRNASSSEVSLVLLWCLSTPCQDHSRSEPDCEGEALVERRAEQDGSSPRMGKEGRKKIRCGATIGGQFTISSMLFEISCNADDISSASLHFDSATAPVRQAIWTWPEMLENGHSTPSPRFSRWCETAGWIVSNTRLARHSSAEARVSRLELPAISGHSGATRHLLGTIGRRFNRRMGAAVSY